MPELPEVETTLRGIHDHLVDARVADWEVRQPRLRWPVEMPEQLRGGKIRRVWRRAKYLVVELDCGALILHLGMSGSLRLLPRDTPPRTHDHVDLMLDSGWMLRLTDPRRFGSIHFQALSDGEAEQHWLLAGLGPEPLGNAFSGDYLYQRARGRRLAVKNFIMDAKVVVGVGNIYANEALFSAGIRPRVAAGRVTRSRYERLARAVRDVLAAAIAEGGTTLRDFVGGDGRPGYFSSELNVYGRESEPCRVCATPLTGIRTGQRATVYCRCCQR